MLYGQNKQTDSTPKKKVLDSRETCIFIRFETKKLTMLKRLHTLTVNSRQKFQKHSMQMNYKQIVQRKHTPCVFIPSNIPHTQRIWTFSSGLGCVIKTEAAAKQNNGKEE